MTMGDVLIKHSYPEIANNQCFERYLIKLHNVQFLSIEDNLVKILGLDNENNLELSVTAILGSGLATFKSVEKLDPTFHSRKHQITCQKILIIFQKVMQAILKNEKYCWLVYNGTINVYMISQTLIRYGHSMIVVEPLTWASCCLETSIPLLNIPNLKWRATIYTAVCQALYNIELDMEAEAFARRGLLKISELHELYQLSRESQTVENAQAICESTLKMGIMIFKRNVFETRRRPKTFLRPKTKVNFKEVLQTNWPRTGTERILAEMFESPSQQILAILEALKQPTRSIGKIEAAAAENDWEILDVYSELFYAAIAIINGRSTSTSKAEKGFIPEYGIIDLDPDSSQLTLAVNSGREISIETTFELICWAFSYGNWEFLDCMIEPLSASIKDAKNLQNKISIENTLQLFTLIRKTTHNSNFVERKTVKLPEQTTDEDKSKTIEIPNPTRNTQRSVSSMSKETKSSKSKKENSSDGADEKTKSESKQSQDSITQLADLIENILDNEFEVDQYIQEILIEAGCILWTKCKSVFQSTQDGSFNNHIKSPTPKIGKWLHILKASHRILTVTNFANINTVSYAELSIRLALLLEQLAINGGFFSEDTTDVNIDEYSVDMFIESLKSDKISKSEKCITIGKQILGDSLMKINRFRNFDSMNREFEITKSDNILLINNTSDDLFLEMNSIYLRICARELAICFHILVNENITMAVIRKSKLYSEAIKFCNKNLILIAIFQSHITNLLKNHLSPNEVVDLINNIRSLVGKSENNLSNVKSSLLNINKATNSDRLPAPIVYQKGSGYIEVVLDENLHPEMKEKIGWVRLYARPVDTPNAEVRLTDDKLSGTGIESAASDARFTINDLVPNEQYILAFAAFDKFGYPIGRGIGHSTKKILATDNIIIQSAMNIIAQILYEIDLKEEVIWYENILWKHFMEPSYECKKAYQKKKVNFSKLHNEHKVNPDLLNCSSPMILRQFCILVLSSVDCECRLRNITNDISHKSSSQIEDQIHRLRLSDKLISLFVICKKLKDHILTMEIFTTVCSLMIPIINHNQFYQPFSEVLITCINTIYNLPRTTWIKVPLPLKNDIHHLVASVGFYLLKYMNKFQLDNELSESIRNSITILLQMTGNSPFTVVDQEDPTNASITTSRIEEVNDKIQTNIQRKAAIKSNRNDGLLSNNSVQQLSFEIFKFSMAKQSLTDHQLSGSEEPDILMAYISNLPSRIAYKEVSKFSRKTRYFQFIVEILHKAVVEGNLEQSLNYYKEIREWLRKRNESILGRPLLQIQNQINRETNTNRTQLEHKDQQYSRSMKTEEEVEDTKRPPKQKRKTKYKVINVRPNMTDNERQIQEQAELKAIDVLSTLFCSMYKQSQKRKRFRQVSEYERAARVKMNCSMAMSYLGLAHNKIDLLTQLLYAGFRFSDIPEIEDVTKFLLDGTGNILPLEEITMHEDDIIVIKTTKQQPQRQTDTPRTYRSDNNSEKRIVIEIPKLLNQFVDLMNKVPFLLKRAVVLATRNENWILLSKASALSWFSLSLFINTTCRLIKFINMAKKDTSEVEWSQIPQINLKNVFKVFSMLVYLGSEALMDMKIKLSQSWNKTFQPFDQTFIENFILRSIHILFETGSYEKTVHIILRFTQLSNYVFVNCTHPILIKCQQKLSEQAKNNQERNSDWTDEMCQQYINESLVILNWSHMDCSNYNEFLIKRQTGKLANIKLNKRKSKIIHQLQNEESHIQNLLSILKSESQTVLRFSVPIDYVISEREWIKYRDEHLAKKSWIELCHKRNYFLFLQSSDCNRRKTSSDLSIQNLLVTYKTQLDNSVMLNEMEYYSLILRDMGDIYNEHLNKPKVAATLWNESLDSIFNLKQSLQSIKNFLSVENHQPIKFTSQMEKLISKFGVINCLIIGGLLSRICRFTNKNADERLNICIQAATFYKAIYATSFAHPKDDLEYLDHSLFLDSVIQTPLVSKLHIFSNCSFIDIQDIESQLYFLISHLIQAGYNQFCISLLALYEHIVYTICKNPIKCIQVQIFKLEICIKLQKFSTASRIIFQLFTGDKIPQLSDSRPAATVSKTPTTFYNDQKHITDEKNEIVLDKILSRRINPGLSQKIGQSFSNKISLLQAEFLMEISSCIPGSPEIVNSKSYNTPEESSLSKKPTIKKSELLGLQTEEESHSILDNLSAKMQFQSWKDINLLLLKGLMLDVASNIIHPMIEEFLSSIQREDMIFLKWTLEEVENVLLALVVQAKNCRLRQCSRSGARLAMFACNLLQEYLEQPVCYDAKSTRILGNLTILFHMRCNKEMVECLLNETSLGNVLDPSDTALSDLPLIKDLIMSCICDCEDNVMMQHKAWFIASLGQYALSSGYELVKYVQIIQESFDILETENFLSDDSEDLLINTKLKLLNVHLSTNTLVSILSLDQTQKQLNEIHDRLLILIDNKYFQSVFWNANNPELSSIEMINVYDQRYIILQKMKLLFGILEIEKSQFLEDKQSQRLKALSILNIGLDLCRSLSRRETWIEVEYIMIIGRIQKYLIANAKVSASSALSTLVEGLKLTLLSSGHLGIQKQFLLEICLTSMHCSRLCTESYNCDGEIIGQGKLTVTPKFTQQIQNQKSFSKTDALNYRKLSWLSLKCANQITDCIQNLNNLKSDSSRIISKEAQDNLPISALFDLFGRYMLGKPRIIFKNEIEQELSRMPESRVYRDNEHLQEQISRMKKTIKSVYLSQILAYQELIIKLTNNQFLTQFEESGSNIKSLTRCIFGDHLLFEKESQIHKYLKQNVPEYNNKCTTSIPNDILVYSSLNTVEGLDHLSLKLVNQSLTNTKILDINSDQPDKEVTLLINYPIGILGHQEMVELLPFEKTEVNETEIQFQFYEPPFECNLQNNSLALLIYGCTKKIAKSVNKLEATITGWLLISRREFLQVYRDLQESAQLLEIMSSNSEQAANTKSETTKKQPSSNNPNTSNTKIQKTNIQQLNLSTGSEISNIEIKIRQVFDKIVLWNCVDSELPFAPVQNILIKNTENSFIIGSPGSLVNIIPFDLSKENIRMISNAFNPILSRPISNNGPVAKFIQEILGIDI